jgi:hypothetical protein
MVEDGADLALFASMATTDSVLCDFFVEMLRGSAELVRELLCTRADLELKGLSGEAASLERGEGNRGEQPDAVMVFRTRVGRPSLAVVIAVQMHVDASKPALWDRYVDEASRQHRCSALLLVVAPEPHIARWAKAALAARLGDGLRPSVVSYQDLPKVVDAKVARRLPELAVLSALAHPCVEGVLAATVGISEMPCECRAQRAYAGLMAALPERLRQELGSDA